MTSNTTRGRSPARRPRGRRRDRPHAAPLAVPEEHREAAVESAAGDVTELERLARALGCRESDLVERTPDRAPGVRRLHGDLVPIRKALVADAHASLNEAMAAVAEPVPVAYLTQRDLKVAARAARLGRR